jgi:hypothetical protein
VLAILLIVSFGLLAREYAVVGWIGIVLAIGWANYTFGYRACFHLIILGTAGAFILNLDGTGKIIWGIIWSGYALYVLSVIREHVFLQEMQRVTEAYLWAQEHYLAETKRARQ